MRELTPVSVLVSPVSADPSVRCPVAPVSLTCQISLQPYQPKIGTIFTCLIVNNNPDFGMAFACISVELGAALDGRMSRNQRQLLTTMIDRRLIVKKWISALAVACAFALVTATAYATPQKIGEGSFSDGSYRTSDHGGLNGSDAWLGDAQNMLTGTDYYALGYSYWATGAYINQPDTNDYGTFTLKWGPLDSALDHTIGSVNTTWGNVLAGFDACFDSANSGSVFVLGLKDSCFTNNILNSSDLPNGETEGGFFGHVALFMDQGTAVPAPRVAFLFLLGVIAIGFAAGCRRNRFHA